MWSVGERSQVYPDFGVQPREPLWLDPETKFLIVDTGRKMKTLSGASKKSGRALRILVWGTYYTVWDFCMDAELVPQKKSRGGPGSSSSKIAVKKDVT